MKIAAASIRATRKSLELDPFAFALTLGVLAEPKQPRHVYDGTVIREDEPLPDKYRQQRSEFPGKLWRHAWHCTDRKCNVPASVTCRCGELREPIPAPVAESTP